MGSQYRSAVFYHDEEQKEAAEAAIKKWSGSFSKPIVTQVLPATTWYAAEDYHQKYLEKKGHDACVAAHPRSAALPSNRTYFSPIVQMPLGKPQEEQSLIGIISLWVGGLGCARGSLSPKPVLGTIFAEEGSMQQSTHYTPLLTHLTTFVSVPVACKQVLLCVPSPSQLTDHGV